MNEVKISFKLLGGGEDKTVIMRAPGFDDIDKFVQSIKITNDDGSVPDNIIKSGFVEPNAKHIETFFNKWIADESTTKAKDVLTYLKKVGDKAYGVKILYSLIENIRNAVIGAMSNTFQTHST